MAKCVSFCIIFFKNILVKGGLLVNFYFFVKGGLSDNFGNF